MKKVSIMIPLYNSGKLICEALDSCLSQTYKNIEIIVVNDGSTDESPDYVVSYMEQYDNIKMITTENRGLASTRNEALRYATGDYFYFLDNDDWIESNLVEECVGAMQEDLDYVFFDANIMELDGEQKWKKTGELCFGLDEKKIYTGSELVEESYKANCLHQVWRGFYRKEFIEDNKLRFIDGLVIEDLPFWFEVVMCANKTKYIKKSYHNYRFVQNSITRSPMSWKKADTSLKITDHILTLLVQRNHEKHYCLMAALKIKYLLREMQEKADMVFCASVSDKESEILQIKKAILQKADSLFCEDDNDLLVSKYYIFQETVFLLGVYEKEWIEKLEQLYFKVKKLLIKKMEKWGMNEGENVGIYGMGRNADILLMFYEKEFGKLPPNVVFIDSYKETGKFKHLNREVVNVKDIRAYKIKKVIICSYLYEENMANTLYELYGKDIKVIKNCDDMQVSVEDCIFPDRLDIFKRLSNPTEKNRILLLFTPDYANVGDHLIAKGVKKFIEKYMSDYEMLELSNTEYLRSKSLLYKLVNENDIVTITGGGFLGTLWPKNNVVFFECAEGFKNNPVVVFPQSLFLSDDNVGAQYAQKMKELFDANKKLILCLRERLSYDRALQIFGKKERICLFPDMALCLACDDDERNVQREGIGVFFRKDPESVLDQNTKRKVKSVLESSHVKSIESSMQYHNNVLPFFRDDVVEEKLREISGYKFVITDMLHCMIACVLTKTPCFATNNLSKKVEGVYDWIKDLDYVTFSKEMDERTLQESLAKEEYHMKGFVLEDEFSNMRGIFQRGNDV